MTEEAPPVTTTRKAVPPNAAAAVAKALEKLPADRFASGRAFAAALSDPAFGPPRVRATRAPVRAGFPAWVSDPRSIVLGVLALGALGLWLFRPVETPAHLEPVSANFTITPAPGERLAAEPPAVSSDGSTIVYVVRDSVGQRLRLRRLNEFESQVIEGTEGAKRPFFSADGERVGFWIGLNQVVSVPIAGGRRQSLGSLTVWGDRPLWAADGRIYTGDVGSGIWARQEGQSEPEQVTFPRADRGERAHLAPRALPGGRLLFTVLTDSGMTLATLAERGASHERLPLVVDAPAEYLEPGLLVFPLAGRVQAVSFDPRTLRVLGAPTPIDDGVAMQFTAAWRRAPSIGRATLAYIEVPEGADRRLMWLDREGRRTAIAGIEGSLRWPRLAPGGRRVAVGGIDATMEEEHVWVVDLVTMTRVRLFRQGLFNTEPAWTPDGRRVTYSQRRGAFSALWWQPADASGPPELLHEAPFDTWPTDWSHDGKELLFYGTGGIPLVGDLFVVDLAGNRRTVAGGPGDQRGGRFSPDGRWIAYQSSETGQSEVYVQPYPALDRKWPVSVAGGTEPVWAPDGRELFYRSEDRLMAVSVTADSVFAASPPRELFAGIPFTDPGGDQSYDVSPDGQRFLTIDPGPESAATLRVIVNWGGRLAAWLRGQEAGRE